MNYCSCAIGKLINVILNMPYPLKVALRDMREGVRIVAWLIELGD